MLRQPALMAGIAVNLWGLAALAFAAVNATESAELAASAAVVGASRRRDEQRHGLPARGAQLAAGGGAGPWPTAPPARPVAPGVAARLTMTWTLVTGVPLLGIAAIAIADLSDLHLDTTTQLAILLLAVIGLVVGLRVHA